MHACSSKGTGCLKMVMALALVLHLQVDAYWGEGRDNSFEIHRARANVNSGSTTAVQLVLQ